MSKRCEQTLLGDSEQTLWANSEPCAWNVIIGLCGRISDRVSVCVLLREGREDQDVPSALTHTHTHKVDTKEP